MYNVKPCLVRKYMNIYFRVPFRKYGWVLETTWTIFFYISGTIFSYIPWTIFSYIPMSTFFPISHGLFFLITWTIYFLYHMDYFILYHLDYFPMLNSQFLQNYFMSLYKSIFCIVCFPWFFTQWAKTNFIPPLASQSLHLSTGWSLKIQ